MVAARPRGRRHLPRHGPAWREAKRGHLSLAQLKVMSAIEQLPHRGAGRPCPRCEDCGSTPDRLQLVPYGEYPDTGSARKAKASCCLELERALADSVQRLHNHWVGPRPLHGHQRPVTRRDLDAGELIFRRPRCLRRLRTGPSGPYIDGFADSLERRAIVLPSQCAI